MARVCLGVVKIRWGSGYTDDKWWVFVTETAALGLRRDPDLFNVYPADGTNTSEIVLQSQSNGAYLRPWAYGLIQANGDPSAGAVTTAKANQLLARREDGTLGVWRSGDPDVRTTALVWLYPYQKPSEVTAFDLQWVTKIDYPKLYPQDTSLQSADLSVTHVRGVFQAGPDFSRAKLPEGHNAELVSNAAHPARFVGATAPASFLGPTGDLWCWPYFDLRDATITALPRHLSSPAHPLDGTHLRLTGAHADLRRLDLPSARLDHSELTGLDLSGGCFDQAQMTGSNLDGAILTGSHMAGVVLDHASLLRAVIQGTDLTGAKLTGSQFDGSTMTTATLTSATLDEASLIGVDLANATMTSVTMTNALLHGANLAGAVLASAVMSQVQAQPQDPGPPSLGSRRQPACILSGAILTDAVLTDANLFGVQADKAQIYSLTGEVRLDGAILELADLTDANLWNANVKSAHLMGVQMSGALLIDAQLNGTNLAPSLAAGETVTDLSYSHLQGADFTDARIMAANLAGAEVALDLSGPRPVVYQGGSSEGPPIGGVHLFCTDAADLEALLARAASETFDFGVTGDKQLKQIEQAMDAGDTTILRPIFAAHAINLAPEARVAKLTPLFGQAWSVNDQQAGHYTVWQKTTTAGSDDLAAGPALDDLRTAFAANGFPLAIQASVRQGSFANDWLLDNASEFEHNFALGYVSFDLRPDGTTIHVYGTLLHVERRDAKNSLHIETIQCVATTLPIAAVDDRTICPNGQTIRSNKQAGGWDPNHPALNPTWMETSKPPTPPTCVPTNVSWCPTPPGSS